MNYLVDTDVLIELERNIPEELLKRFASHAGHLFISSISLSELSYGVAKSSRPAVMREALDALLTQLSIVHFDGNDAFHAGDIRNELRKQGKPIGSNDLLIAAQARARGFTMVTGNLREFERVPGLRLENWLKE